MEGREASRKASGVADNPRGDRQGVGWGVELPQGIKNPISEEFSQGDDTPRVTPKGYRVRREDV